MSKNDTLFNISLKSLALKGRRFFGKVRRVAQIRLFGAASDTAAKLLFVRLHLSSIGAIRFLGREPLRVRFLLFQRGVAAGLLVRYRAVIVEVLVVRIGIVHEIVGFRFYCL